MSRSRRIAAVVAIITAALVAGYAVQWSTVSRADIGRSDFASFYVGGTLLREGHRADLYSDAVQAPVHAALVAPAHTGNLPFVNPPPAAVIMAPVSLLPFALAYRLWQALQLLLLLAAVVIAARAAPWSALARRARAPATAAIAGFAVTGTLAMGLLAQWDGLSAIGLAGAYALWRRDRRFAGGLLLAATAATAKPHLALGLAAFLLGWRERRVLAGAAVGVAGAVLVSLAAVGTSGLSGLVSATADDATRWPLASFLGFTGFTGSWLSSAAAAQEIAAFGSLLAFAICGALGARVRLGSALEPCLGAATLLSLVGSPHLLSQDLVLLAPMLVVVLAWASREDRAESWPGARTRAVFGGWAVLCIAAAVDLGSEQAAPPGRLVPIVLTALAAILAWQVRGHRRRAPAGLATT